MKSKYLLSSILREANVEVLLAVNDKLIDDVAISKMYDFVRTEYAINKTFPSKQAVELKFNTTLDDTTDPAKYWLKEVSEAYVKSVNEKAIVAAAKSPAKAQQIFKQAILDSEIGDSLTAKPYGTTLVPRTRAYSSSTKIKYISTTDAELDSIAYGIRPADLWTIGGREGIGKTWVILHLAKMVDDYVRTVMLSDKPILFITCEMDIDECEDRLDCIRFGLDYGKFQSGRLSRADIRRYTLGTQSIDSNIYFVDDCYTPDDIERYVLLMRPAIVFIDSSHILAKDYDWKEIGKLTLTMKKIVRKHKVPIINTTHLKAGKGRSADGGDVDDFAYGKGFTRDSDVVSVLYATEQMELSDELGWDFVKARRGHKKKLLVTKNLSDSTIKIEDAASGVGNVIPASVFAAATTLLVP